MIERSAVRAIIINQAHDILLVHMKPAGLLITESPKTSFWLTPGGSIEPGETQRSALIREIHEETGITESSIEQIFEPAAWYNELVLTYKGVPTLFKESFFLVKVSDNSSATYEHNPDEQERNLTDELRWWKLEDILTSQETFFPVGFPKLIDELLKTPPTETILLQKRK
jgi:8-oxo-dGTP pyrophosphatase MutT (NUDIX family)